MINHYLEELNTIFLQRLENMENVEDYLVLKKQIEVLNNNYKELVYLLDKKLLEVF